MRVVCEVKWRHILDKWTESLERICAPHGLPSRALTLDASRNKS